MSASARRALAFAIVAAVVGWIFLDAGNRPNFIDFDVYWTAGLKAAKHQTVYDVLGHFQFKYSPFVAALWSIPTSYFKADKESFQWLHYVVTTCAWYTVFYFLALAVDVPRAFYLWLAVAIVFAVGLRDEVKLGQANIWPLLLVLPAWLARTSPRKHARFGASGLAIGAAFALAVQWKLYALVLVPLWIMRRRPGLWLGAIAKTLLTLGGCLALLHAPTFAIGENVRWCESLTESSRELLLSTYNVSLIGMLGKWSEHFGSTLRPWAYVVCGVAALGWLGVFAFIEREARILCSQRLYFFSSSWLWAGVLVLNPLVWPYWLSMCAPLFITYVAGATAKGLLKTGPVFWVVCSVFTYANMQQNFHVVHEGASLVAVILLMSDALRREISWLNQMRLERSGSGP